ncbi:MAG: histone deacetylase [Planctomycetota bacterium]|nr:histone deacetylase [Planctomycetota bacterium]
MDLRSTMTMLYYDPIFLEHDTGRHPENAGRLRPVIKHLDECGLTSRCERVEWEPISIERLCRVHSLKHVDAVKAFAARGGGQMEADTVVSPKSYDVALMAAGAVCDAVTRVVRGDQQRALCLVRPPGHHALAGNPMGFCLFNNVATGARLAIDEFELQRVLIVDWDVHHGNGTQAMFWEDSQVGFFSAHRYPFYPGTGAADEIGAGAGLGTTCNLPIKFGISREDYLAGFRAQLERFADQLKPQLVIISAGFDSHRTDPIGSLGLESEDFAPLTQLVLDIADTHADSRVVSVLEGGYNPSALTACVAVHLEGLL